MLRPGIKNTIALTQILSERHLEKWCSFFKNKVLYIIFIKKIDHFTINKSKHYTVYTSSISLVVIIKLTKIKVFYYKIILWCNN